MICAALAAAAFVGAAQEIPCIPAANCTNVDRRNLEERSGADLAPFSSFETCSPLGREGRHQFGYDGFAGEVVSFHVAGGIMPWFGGARGQLSMTVAGPGGFTASSVDTGPDSELRVTLPATGRYQVTVRQRDPRVHEPSSYRIRTEEHEAQPAPPGDCSRYALPNSYVAIDMDPRPVAPGGEIRMKPGWGMRGKSYDVPFACLSNWSVSHPQWAALSADGRILRVSRDAPPGTRLSVEADVGGGRERSFVDVAAPPRAAD